MNDAPLTGIRVADLSRVFAMPYAGAYLADMGAEVIKIDTHHSQFVDTTRTLNGPYPDNEPGDLYWERGGTFQTLNRGKRSLTLDLRAPEALEVLKNLLQVSDIFLENFTPRVLARFGLDYASVKQVRPDLIMVSNTGYGHSGPYSNFGAMATALEPTHGTGAFTGYLEPDAREPNFQDPKAREPNIHSSLVPGTVPNKIANSYTDFLASWSAQLAILACLLYRARTGRGAWIDLAMYQVGASFMGEGLLDYDFNGRRVRRIGNRHESFSPHGCYPCRGDDEWVVVAVRNDAEWQAFCLALDRPGLARDPRFADPVTRHQNQDALDEMIRSWTSDLDQYQVMEELQSRGIPSGPVLNARGLLADPHLRARGFFESVKHSPETELGRREYLSRGWTLSDSDVQVRGEAPRLGEGNEYVLGDVLGLNSAEIEDLRKKGVIGEELLGGGAPSTVPLARQEELGWIVRHEPGYPRA
jgi:crotonobetainyl-CoA:carnitine CoA-transferase CaiB-like acyl-CoA transferase